MNRTTMERIMAIQEKAWQDSTTSSLSEELSRKNIRFLRTMETISPEQQEVIFDYIGALIELQNQFLVYAAEADYPESQPTKRPLV